MECDKAAVQDVSFALRSTGTSLREAVDWALKDSMFYGILGDYVDARSCLIDTTVWTLAEWQAYWGDWYDAACPGHTDEERNAFMEKLPGLAKKCGCAIYEELEEVYDAQGRPARRFVSYDRARHIERTRVTIDAVKAIGELAEYLVTSNALHGLIEADSDKPFEVRLSVKVQPSEPSKVAMGYLAIKTEREGQAHLEVLTLT